MAKKIDEAEVKKECPSCGLGVALDATICEFCGWDFEEEDEWILQIEKLERDLMLEKQRFEPGSFNEKVESTLHRPEDDLKAIRSAQKSASVETVKPSLEQKPARPPEKKPAPVAAPAPEPKMRRVRTVKQGPAEAETEQPAVSEEPQKKVRLVRKVKQ
jgi:hypothetical protein